MRWLKFVAIVVFVLVIGISGFAIYSLRSPNPENTGSVDFVVAQGLSTVQVAEQLKEKGLIKNAFVFASYIKLTNKKIMPGTYELPKDSSATKIAEQLSVGKFKTARITLIEGWRATDIERYLVEEKKLIQFTGFAEKATMHEGYLFPDTYEIRVDTTIEELIKLLRENFATRTAGLFISPDQVTLASIVEREAASDSERADIAAVYFNRLRVGMKLQADPTIQYAKGNWRAVTLEEYQTVISPYNTYLNYGLPPGPIANPGLKSLQAVLNPSKHNYFFFFHARGETFFSATYSEHARKIRENF